MKKYFHKTPFWLKLIYPGLVWKTITSSKDVFLTFDDGPTQALTPWILQTLKEYDFKATFFCVGQNIKENPELFDAMKKDGHHVANHTFNHQNGWRTPTVEYLENIYACEKVINQTEKKLFRPPYGRISARQIRAVKRAGYKIIMWDVLSGDFDHEISSKDCLHYSQKYTEPGSIIVFHDNVKSAHILKKVLPSYLDFLQQNDFKSALWN